MNQAVTKVVNNYDSHQITHTFASWPKDARLNTSRKGSQTERPFPAAAWVRAKIVLLLFALAGAAPAAHAFTAQLQGLSNGSNVWQTVNLTGWQELDFIPCRVYLTGGPATNQVIEVDFDHTKSLTTPGIQ